MKGPTVDASEFAWEQRGAKHVLLHEPSQTECGHVESSPLMGWDAYSYLDHCFVGNTYLGEDERAMERAKVILLKHFQYRPQGVNYQV